jgi:DNA primase
MKVDAFLDKLTKVKRTGNGTWLACCPAHEDRSPSMSVRELDDGRVLVHCFAGCGRR